LEQTYRYVFQQRIAKAEPLLLITAAIRNTAVIVTKKVEEAPL